MNEWNATRTGRWVGIGILITFAIGLFSNFKLQPDLFGGEGLLVNAAAHPLAIGWIAVLQLVTGLTLVAIAVGMNAFVGRAQPMLAIAYCVLAAATLAIGAVESATLLAFRTLSEPFVAAGASPDAAYQIAAKLLKGLRNGVHFLHVLLGGFGMLVLFALLHRARLVPPLLAVAGMVAAPLQMFAVGRPLFGLDVLYVLLAPLALVFFAVAAWLLAKGFAVSAETVS